MPTWGAVIASKPCGVRAGGAVRPEHGPEERFCAWVQHSEELGRGNGTCPGRSRFGIEDQVSPFVDDGSVPIRRRRRRE